MYQIMLLVVVLAVFGASSAQMIRQCTCNEFDPCLRGADRGFMQCADQCQHHASDLGASYPALRQCIMSKEAALQSVINCQKSQMSGACAAAPGGMVPKRYPETLKLAAFSEINSMLARSGLLSESKTFMAAGKKFATCVMKCMERGPGRCIKKLKCGLALPSDNVLVQSTKRCAIQNGFNTPAIQQLCHCAAGAGVRGLAPLCNRIQIS